MPATAAPIEAGLTAVRSLLSQLGTMGLSDAARYEIDFRLQQKERDYEDAVIAAHGLTFEAIADDGLIVAGQPIKLSLVTINRGATDVDVTDVSRRRLCRAHRASPARRKKDAVYSCAADAQVPADARLTAAVLPRQLLEASGESGARRLRSRRAVRHRVRAVALPRHVSTSRRARSTSPEDMPIQFRYVKDIYNGDKRMELNVVPAFSVQVTPGLAVIPAPRTGEARASTARST